MLASKTVRSNQGDTIIEEGFVPCHLRRLDSGLARVTCVIGGRLETVGHLLAGDYFSTESITGGTSTYRVDVLSRTAAYSVIYTDNLGPAEMRALAQRLGRQAHRMAVCHALTRRGDLRTRTAHYLLGLAASPLAALEDDESVWIRGLTHEMIGSAVGCIRVHATRVLRSLEEEGLLSTAYRSVRLLDVPGLYKAAGADSDVSARMLSALFGGEDSREGVAASVIETLLASRTQGLRGALA